MGDDVRADLVLEQSVNPVRRDDGSRRDEQVAVGHHDAAAVVAHLDIGGQIGVHGPVQVELGLGEASERRGVDAIPGLALRGRHLSQQRFGLAQEGGADRAVQLQTQLEELLAAPAAQHLQLQLELASLRRQDPRQARRPRPSRSRSPPGVSR